MTNDPRARAKRLPRFTGWIILLIGVIFAFANAFDPINGSSAGPVEWIIAALLIIAGIAVIVRQRADRLR